MKYMQYLCQFLQLPCLAKEGIVFGINPEQEWLRWCGYLFI